MDIHIVDRLPVQSSQFQCLVIGVCDPKKYLYICIFPMVCNTSIKYSSKGKHICTYVCM